MLPVDSIYHMDCMEGLKEIAPSSIDMILCDLPYNTTVMEWDKALPLSDLWEHYERVIKDNGAIVLFCSQPFTTDLIQSNRKLFRYELIWNKGRGFEPQLANVRPMKAHENIAVFYKRRPVYNPQKVPLAKPDRRKSNTVNGGQHTLIKAYGKVEGKTYTDRYPTSIIDGGFERGYHPTQKPTKLCEWLIKTYTQPGELVLDTCMGSGTTAVAAINTGRHFIGFEKEEHYYTICLQRIQQAMAVTDERMLG